MASKPTHKFKFDPYQIIELRKQGKTNNEILGILGITETPMRLAITWLKRQGVEMPKINAEVPGPEKGAYRKYEPIEGLPYRQQGWSNYDIGAHFGVSEITIRRGWQALKSEGVEVPDLPRSSQPVRRPQPQTMVGEEVSREEILDDELKEHKALLKKVRKDEVQQERLIRRLEAAIVQAKPRYVPRPIKKSRPGDDRLEMVLLFSDTHASEVVNPEEVMYMNSYNWEVMLERMRRLQELAIAQKEAVGRPIDTLHIFQLGDMLSGDIHEELQTTNDRTTAEAAVDFAYDTAVWTEEFVPHFGKVKVSTVPGNHPRKSKKPSAKQAHNNADWISYKMQELYHRANPNIEYNNQLGSFNIQMVADRWRFLLMHGDGIRSTMPGVPWGGVSRRIATLEAQFVKQKAPIDYFTLGHFHTLNALEGVQSRVYMNGSVKGLDEYSMKAFGSGRDASQLLLVVSKKHGVISQLPLDLQGVMPASEGWPDVDGVME